MRFPLEIRHEDDEGEHQTRHKTALQRDARVSEVVAHNLVSVCSLEVNGHGGIRYDALVESSKTR